MVKIRNRPRAKKLSARFEKMLSHQKKCQKFEKSEKFKFLLEFFEIEIFEQWSKFESKKGC